MATLNTTQLAERLGITKGRVSQLVKKGALDGCFQGDGRARRFDLVKAAEALGHRLDPGQAMGNGAKTRARVKAITAGKAEQASVGEQVARKTAAPGRDGPLPDKDPDRYELARIQKAEEEARKLRRQNAEAEGDYVLASQVALQTQRLISREVGEFERVLRDGARAIADRMGVDFKSARQILLECWREHRETRADQLAGEAGAATMTAEERDEDI